MVIFNVEYRLAPETTCPNNIKVKQGSLSIAFSYGQSLGYVAIYDICRLSFTTLHLCRLSLENLLLVWAVGYSDYDVFEKEMMIRVHGYTGEKSNSKTL